MQLGRETGSIMNHLMASGKSTPEVGKGATVFLYSDRHAYQVTKVEKNKVWIKRCNSKRIDSNGMSEDQEYDYSELYNHEQELVFRNSHWREVHSEIVYINDEISNLPFSERRHHFDEHHRLKWMDGITTMKFSYPKIHIKFGIQEEYYDYTR